MEEEKKKQEPFRVTTIEGVVSLLPKLFEKLGINPDSFYVVSINPGTALLQGNYTPDMVVKCKKLFNSMVTTDNGHIKYEDLLTFDDDEQDTIIRVDIILT